MPKKKGYVAYYAIDANEVKKHLVWVRGEIKAELKEKGESIRLSKIEYETGRFLRKYNMI